jgi:hypothetical protein
MRLPLGLVYDILWHGRVDFTGKFDKVDDLSVFSRVLPCGFSDVRNCRETSSWFYGDGKQARIFKMFICVKPSFFEFSGDLQNRMCSDIAVTSKVEILDTSFMASAPARSGHWE